MDARPSQDAQERKQLSTEPGLILKLEKQRPGEVNGLDKGPPTRQKQEGEHLFRAPAGQRRAVL